MHTDEWLKNIFIFYLFIFVYQELIRWKVFYKKIFVKGIFEKIYIDFFLLYTNVIVLIIENNMHPWMCTTRPILFSSWLLVQTVDSKLLNFYILDENIDLKRTTAPNSKSSNKNSLHRTYWAKSVGDKYVLFCLRR